MFRSIDVWKILNAQTLVRYRCFQLLTNNRYCVQSADFYTLPLDESRVRSLEAQFVELLIEQRPDERTDTFASLQEAIAHHDEEFRQTADGGTGGPG